MKTSRAFLTVGIGVATLLFPTLAEAESPPDEIRGRFLTQIAEFLTLPIPRALAVARVDEKVAAWGVMGGAVNLLAAKEAATVSCEAKIVALGIQAECVVEAVSDDSAATVSRANQGRSELMNLKAIPRYELLFEDQVILFLESGNAKALSVAQAGGLVIAWGLRTEEEDQPQAEKAATESCQRNVEARGLTVACQIIAAEPAAYALGRNSDSPQAGFPVQGQAVTSPTYPEERAVKRRSQVDSVIAIHEIPITGSGDVVAIPGHEDIEIRGVRLALNNRRAKATLFFYQHQSSDKEVLFTVDLVSGSGEYLGGRTQYIYLDEGEKNTVSISFGLNQKYLDSGSGGLVGRVKIHSVRHH